MKALFGQTALAFLLGATVFSTQAQDGSTGLFVQKRFSEARDYAAGQRGLDELGILGWSEFMLENYGAAEQAFLRLAKVWPNDFDAMLGLAWVRLKTGKLDEVTKYLARAEKGAESWQGFMVEDIKGWLAMKKGDLAAAEAHFTKELGMSSAAGKADPNVGLGWVAFNRGDLAKAKAAFRAGIERDRKCFFCRDGLARIALVENDAREALRQITEGIAITADSSGLNAMLAPTLIAINDLELSLRTYGDLLRRYPKTAAYRVGYGYSLLAQGKVAEAEAEFQQVLRNSKGDPGALAGLADLQVYKTAIVKEAWAAYYKGDYADALKLFEARRSDAAAKKNPSAEDGRGWTLLALERPREARDAFLAALAIDTRFHFSTSGRIVAEGQLLTGYRKAWSLIDLQRFDEAVALLVKMRGETPPDLVWLIDDAVAWIAYYRKDYDGAEKAFGAILAANKDAYLSRGGLGWVAMQRKDYRKGASLIREALLQNPYQVLSAYSRAAETLTDAGQFHDAREILTLAERIYPYSADSHYLMARVKSGLNDDAGAGLSLARAAELAPLYIEPAFDKLKLSPNGRQPALLSLAWGLYYAGAAQAAVPRFQQYAAAGGSATSGSTGLGWALLATKKPAEAAQAFQAALAKGSSADAHSGLGWAALAGNDYSAAEKSFKAALKVTPFYASAQSGLATVQYQKTLPLKEGWEAYYKGDYKRALAAFQAKAGEAAAAGSAAADDGRGWTLMAMGDVKAAAAAFAAALRIDPDYYSAQSGQIAARRSDLVHYGQAWDRMERGLFDEARTLFERAGGEIPAELRWLVDDGLAWLSYYRKDYEGAEKAFRAVIAATPGAYLSHRGLGNVLAERKQYPEAAKSLLASFNLAPYQGVGTYTLPSLKMIDGGAAAPAREVLQLGERVYPYSADIQWLLARAYAGAGDEARAGEKAAAAAALAPLYVEPVFDKLKLGAAALRSALANLGWGHYFAGDHAKALKRFEEATKAGSSDPNVARGTAFALFRQGKLREAVPLLEEAAKQEPKPLLPVVEIVPIPGTEQYWTIEYTAGSTLAWAYYKLGDGARADALFAAALAANPFSIDALTGRGYVKLLLKDLAAARALFEQALKISPAYPDARNGLAAAKS